MIIIMMDFITIFIIVIMVLGKNSTSKNGTGKSSRVKLALVIMGQMKNMKKWHTDVKFSQVPNLKPPFLNL